MTTVSRRGFLKLLGASSAAVIAPASANIWIPDTKVDVPEPKELVIAKQAIWDGGHIGVRVVNASPTGLAIDTLLGECPNYFFAGTPMLAVFSKELKNGWYLYAGNKTALKDGYKANILLAWEAGKSIFSIESA